MASTGARRKARKAAPKTVRRAAARARKDEARAREDEAHARSDEAHARTDEARARADDARAKADERNDPSGKPREGIAEAIFRMSEMLGKNHGPDGCVSPATTDAVTQALLLVLGSAPSVATIDGMLAIQAANGMMYYNAVANQQKTNVLGMAMTAKCVRYMLEPDPEEVIDETFTENVHNA
jgi:hypothetical protein